MPHNLQGDLKRRVPFQAPAEEAYLNLVRSTAYLHHQVVAFFRSHDITDAQYNVLRILTGAGPEGLTCAEVGDRTITRVPDITRLLDRLVNSNLVERERSSVDRRVVRVRITDAGRKIAEDLAPYLVELHRDLLSHLSPEELAQLSALLVRVRHPEGC